VFNFADDQALINAHAKTKALDEDGPSAADYDPTADMKEDERRDEMRHGNVGLHGEPRRPSQDEIAAPVPEKKEDEGAKKVDEDDDDFDMFAEDFADKFAAPAAAQPDAAQEARAPQAGGGGAILEGDDKEGYYKIRPGELLDGRYQVSTTLGRGMFSGVARAVDITTKKDVAIKIMRNNDALRKGGFTEIAILEKLNAADPDDKKHIVRFERAFEYKAHLCMAFENLSMNLREVLKKFGNNVGINLNATRAYAYQIFLALGHMRKCSIIHADLKPDNILVGQPLPEEVTHC
jgi:serine/threonine-protein kinase PRP4